MPASYPPFQLVLNANPGAETGVGASEEEVQSAERELGVSIPFVLRRYLIELGYLSVGSREFYGLGSGVPPHLDLLMNTEAERTEFHPHMPKYLIPLLANGCGDHYCVNLRNGADDPPVVFWDHELDSNQSPEVVGESFSSWLLDQCAESA